MKKELKRLVKKSYSNNIMQYISTNMIGRTFHHHCHILYDIRTLLGNEKKIYTEIGCFNGGSLSLMLQHEFDTEIYTIDPLHLYQEQEQIVKNNIINFNKNNKLVHICKHYSTDDLFLKSLEDRNFKTDILFIDGDHTYEVVQKDFYNFEKFVNIEGFIIFDDYLDYIYSPDVKKAVDDIINNIDKTKYKIIGCLKNYQNSFSNYEKEFSHLNEFIIQKIS